jgi:hypothetical protein
MNNLSSGTFIFLSVRNSAGESGMMARFSYIALAAWLALAGGRRYAADG